MTVFLLIRHGANDMLERDILAGRTPGVHLNERGIREAAALADELASRKIDAVYSSPLERATETAQPIARRQGLSVSVFPAVNEVDFGRWTGRGFDELRDDPLWQAFNQARSATRIPGGEIILEVQLRMVAALEKLHDKHGKGIVAVVSHGDPIRTLVAHCLNIPLDDILRFQIDPASVSVVDMTCRHAPKVLCVNGRGKELRI